MTDRDPINTPSLAGWTIAAGMATLAFAISYVIGELGMMGSALVGSGVLLVVGVILGLPSEQPTAPVAAAAFHATHPAPQPEPVVAPATVVEPVAAALAPAEPVFAEPVAAARPQGLDAARDGQPDDLKRIKGVGPALEGLLHRLGYFHFDQIAAWTPAEIAWVDQNLEGFKGRVTRDEWVAQARALATGNA
jgi:predicted flap endonuclease-1-like 5' DNA nuclease